MTQRQLDELTSDECYELVGHRHVGRLLYLDDLGPVGFPVNFALAGNDVIFRSEANTKFAALSQPMVSFEVDEIGEEGRSGWSVLLRGQLAEVPLDDVAALIHEMGGEIPKPWAVGVHNMWLRLHPTLVSGRRLAEEGVLPVY